jgi:hypothetical protein
MGSTISHLGTLLSSPHRRNISCTSWWIRTGIFGSVWQHESICAAAAGVVFVAVGVGVGVSVSVGVHVDASNLLKGHIFTEANMFKHKSAASCLLPKNLFLSPRTSFNPQELVSIKNKCLSPKTNLYPQELVSIPKN